MLILGRKIQESILIGDDIVVTICGLRWGQVKVGIKAPRHIRILRSELEKKRGSTNDSIVKEN